MINRNWPITKFTMSEIQTFLTEIETFLARTQMSPTRFGKRFAGDPLFVFQLRSGREPRSDTRKRVLEAMRAEVEVAGQ